MLKTYTWAGSILGVLVVTGILYTQYAEADNADPSFEVSFGTSAIQIEDGKSYQIAGSEGSLNISTLSPLSSVVSSELFKHQDGADNLLFASNDQSFVFQAGTYSLDVTLGASADGPSVGQIQNIQQKLFAYIVQTAHAQVGMDDTTTTTITFTVTDSAPADPVVEEAETEDVVEVVQVESTTASERTSNRYREPEPEPRARVLGMSTTTTTTQGQFERFREIVTIVTILSSREAEMNAQQKALLRSILAEIQEMLKGI